MPNMVYFFNTEKRRDRGTQRLLLYALICLIWFIFSTQRHQGTEINSLCPLIPFMVPKDFSTQRKGDTEDKEINLIFPFMPYMVYIFHTEEGRCRYTEINLICSNMVIKVNLSFLQD